MPAKASTPPPLPGTDRHGRLAIALDTALLLPERHRLVSGDTYPPDHDLVKAHPKAFTISKPPPITTTEEGT